MTHPEVCQRGVIDLHTATDPAIGVVSLGQTFHRPGAAHAFKRGVQPQRKQNLGGADCRSPRSAFTRLDPSLQATQFLPLDIPPDDSRPVPFRQQRLQVARPQFNLLAMRVSLKSTDLGILCHGAHEKTRE